MNSVTRYKKILTLDWNRILSFASTAERNIKIDLNYAFLLRVAMLFPSSQSASV